MPPHEKRLYCSFCGHNQHEVEVMIAGPNVFICDACIDLCNEMVAEFREKEEEDAPTT
ncbi:MAG: hypothetical protein KJ890_15655 [Gammaproteobacteria bacterium]|nr:hypothetical protein [Gammaproteobacteria bacterium]MBU1803865.1 hypothetical protein [Gammaproteobacteria bacterium]